MKTIKTLFAVSALAAGVEAHAATQTVLSMNGTMNGMNVLGATADPTLTVNPTAPTFSQLGNFVLTTTGTFGQSDFAYTGIQGTWDFDPYTTAINAGIGGKATVTQSNSVYDIGGAGNGTVTWNAATRTLTLGQQLNYTASTDSTLGTAAVATYNSQASDGVAKWNTTSGVAGACTPSGTVCNGQTSIFLANPNIERFYLTLTFAEDFVNFTGTAVGIDVGGSLPLGKTGNQFTTYSFTGAVPVPAAAWLFGSALVGLAGVSRRKAA